MSNVNTLIENLKEKRKNGDAHADSFISTILKTHELNELNIFFSRLVYNNQFNSSVIPKDFSDYINDNSKLPDWADYAKIELAQQTFTKIGPAFILSYFCKSLPECYACGQGAEILYKTGRLTQHTRRRVAQTAQFVLDVMSPGGLEFEGRGIATALKVRLMHASIRFYFLREVQNKKIEYDVEATGYPINQEDLIGTMLAFSFVVLEGIKKLGFKMSNDEKESILHLWKCIGYLIGIDEVDCISNYDDAGQVWQAITKSQMKKTDEGTALNNLLVDFLDEIIPEKVLDDVVPILMQWLMGKDVSEILNVRKPKIYNPVAVVSFVLGIILLKFESRGFISKITSQYVNMKLMIALENYIAEGENTGIYIPPALRKDWNMDNIGKSMLKIRSK